MSATPLNPKPTVLAVSASPVHEFSKDARATIRLLANLGVEGDTHQGITVQHRSRVAKNPTQPNLRQVHLIHAELFVELRNKGYDITPGQLGENITTQGLDLLSLPTNTKLHIGPTAIIQITGLRNPCKQIDHFRKGLMSAVLDKDAAGNLIRKAGVMAIVLAAGEVKPGDQIKVEHPALPHEPLKPV